MVTLTKVGITIFTLAVVLGPFYTVKDYSITSDLISELGAQHTKNNFIMIAAFAMMGGSIVIDGAKNFKLSLLPFIFFGLFIAVAGVFPHKPLDVSLAYNSTFHALHGIMASISGTAITVGFIWQAFRTRQSQRIICLYMAMVAVLFPVFMISYPDYQGVIQRIMYLQLLGWIWIKYPVSVQRENYRRKHNADL